MKRCGGRDIGNKNQKTTTKTSNLGKNALAYVGNVASQAAQLPYQSYQGPRVAGFTGDQQAAFDAIRKSQGIWQPYTNAASDSITRGGTAIGTGGPQSVYQGYDPESFSAEGLAAYYNPYQENAINSTMANMYRDFASQQNDLLGKSISSGANPFGGDRAGLAAAELARSQGLAMGQTVSGMENQGWQNAMQAYQTEMARQQQAGLTNAAGYATASNENAQRWLDQQMADRQNALKAGDEMGGLGSQVQQQALAGADALNKAGLSQQALNQTQLDIPYQEFMKAQQHPMDQAKFLVDAINGNPVLNNPGSTTTAPGPSLISQLTGLATTAVGAGLPRASGGAVHMADGGLGPLDGTDPMQLSGPHVNADLTYRQPVPDYSGHGVVNPVSTIPEGINALPQIAFSAMPKPYTWPMPTGLAAALAKPVPGDKSGDTRTKAQRRQSRMGYDPTGINPGMIRVGRHAPGGVPNLSIDNSGGPGTYPWPDTPAPTITSEGIVPRPPAGLEPNSGIPTITSTGVVPAPAPARAPRPAITAPPTYVTNPHPVPSLGGLEDAVSPPGTEPVSGGLSAAAPEGGRKPSLRESVMMAGLSMMGGESPFALTNIGKGGAEGLKNWQAQREDIAKLDAQPQMIKGPNGNYWMIYSGGHKMDTGVPAIATSHVMTPEEVKAAGLDPNFHYQKKDDGTIDQIGGGGINIGGTIPRTPEELANVKAMESSKALAGAGAKVWEGFADTLPAASGFNFGVQRLEQLFNSGADITGPDAVITDMVRKATGIALSDNADPISAMQSMISYMAPRMRVTGSGSSSDTDVQMFFNALPSMYGTPEGNQMIIEGLKGIASVNNKIAEIGMAVTTGTMTSEEGAAALKGITANPVGGWKDRLPHPASIDEARAYPPGTTWIDPDGKYHTTPKAH